MGTILGPFDSATWLTLGMLKRDIDYMRGKDADRFRLAIKRQKESYDYLLEACA